jgi:FKBP-type peptidyl-prolyl cis-trans isomerase
MSVMRFGVVGVMFVAFMFAGCEGGGGSGKRVKVTGDSDQRVLSSYMLGRDMGGALKELDADLDLDVFLAAFREVMDDVPSQLPDSALHAIDQQFKRDLQVRREQKFIKMSEDNKVAGEAFLAANRQKPGVIVTESGLQYVVLKEGGGSSPAAQDRVTVNYHGTFIDGKVFDSSIERGSPVTFPVTGVIRGWSEMLQLMKVGSKVKAFIPSELAYGERGAQMRGQQIGPNAALIFEIELLGIEAAEPAPASATPPAPAAQK